MSKTVKLPNGKMVPVIAPLAKEEIDLDPNPTIAVCGQCGIEIKKVMMYACPDSSCPIQRKATF